MIRKDFLPLAKPDITEEEISAVEAIIRSGWWTTGPKVIEFEQKVIEYLNECPEPLYAVGLNSCTAGLFLALEALGIGSGDEVIVPTWTFAATAEVVEWTGATLVLCDVEESSLNIDINKAEKLITKKTKAIIPVHIAGYPCDINGITKLAKKYQLRVVEDAAHAFGSRFNGKKIGNFSDCTVFSFYSTKNLATGEGGMVVSRDKSLIDKIRKKSYFGINKDAFKCYENVGAWLYDIEELGYKYNFDDIHASLGLVQLHRLDNMLARRRDIAQMYRQGLNGLVEFNADSPDHFHTYHLFMVRLLQSSLNRNEVIQGLKKNNIGSSVHYRPLHLHSYYKQRFPEENFPVSNMVFKSILSLPMFSAMENSDVEYVIQQFKAIGGR